MNGGRLRAGHDPHRPDRWRPQFVLNYFRHLADASRLPVYLYSVPPNTAYTMPVDLIAELAEHPNMVGMKGSSGDVVGLQAIVDATPDDFVLHASPSAAATSALTIGCHGVITGSLNYGPRLVTDVVEKPPDRDLQLRLTAVSKAVEQHGVPGVKAAAPAAELEPSIPRLRWSRLPSPSPPRFSPRSSASREAPVKTDAAVVRDGCSQE